MSDSSRTRGTAQKMKCGTHSCSAAPPKKDDELIGASDRRIEPVGFEERIKGMEVKERWIEKGKSKWAASNDCRLTFRSIAAGRLQDRDLVSFFLVPQLI